MGGLLSIHDDVISPVLLKEGIYIRKKAVKV